MKITHLGKKYEVRDARCVSAECLVLGEYQHRSMVPGAGSRNTGHVTLCCMHRAYHGCPEPPPPEATMPERRNGVTTKQMMEAPQDAIYVWPNTSFAYPRNLAHHLGRDDLSIVSPSWVEEWRNLYSASALVVDHATWLLARPIAVDALHRGLEFMSIKHRTTQDPPCPDPK